MVHSTTIPSWWVFAKQDHAYLVQQPSRQEAIAYYQQGDDTQPAHMAVPALACDKCHAYIKPPVTVHINLNSEIGQCSCR